MRRSTLATLDDALLVVVIAVGVLLALQVVGWILGTIMFLVKVAILAVVIVVGVRLVAGRRDRRLDRGYRGELD